MNKLMFVKSPQINLVFCLDPKVGIPRNIVDAKRCRMLIGLNALLEKIRQQPLC